MAICTADRQGSPRRARYAVRALACALLTAIGALAPPPLHAGTYTTTIQSRTITTDTYLKQENATENRGSDPDMRVKRSTGGKIKNAVVSIPLPDMSGKSVLQAWLSLYQSAANSGSMSVTSHALTQSWTESGASWSNRFSSSPWTTPGGTRLSAWTSRRVVSDQTNLSRLSWQVGPIVNAWNLGTLANNGFLLTAESGQDLEMQFRTSEYTTDSTKTPQLILQYTDEPPAIRTGTAEIQPHRVVKGIGNIPWTVWLDVAASGSTPSGAATGFDLITIDHQGALRGRTLDSLFVGATPVPLDQVLWYDNGKSITLRLPRVTVVGRVRAVFHVDVLATQSTEIPVYVDDTATSGCYQQVLWPGNADGLAGNGDTWLLDPSLAVVSVALEPDTLDTVVGLCTQFTLIATDGAGNQYPVQADSFTTYNTASGKNDPAIGTVDATGYFCAKKSGNNFALIAWYANATDGPGYAYAPLHIQPALLPTITSVTLRNRSGASTTTLVPQDTMFVDVVLGDGNGFKDITGADLVLSYNGHAGDANAPAYRAAYRWRRGAPAPFAVIDPVASSWSVVPALCAADTTTNSTSAQTIRFAFRPGVIARASSAGEWTARVNAISSTPADSSAAFSKTGLNAAVRLTAVWDDGGGSFNAGSPGATLLPLRDPADGKVDLHVLANAVYDLQAAVRDLVGTTSPSDTLRAGPPVRPISWAFNSGRTGGGRLDTAYVALTTAHPAATSEAPTAENLYLWIDLPATVPPQDYRGAIRVRLAASGGVRSAEPSIPLTATVTTSGQAAQSVLGEVLPDTVAVGVAGQAFTAYVLPAFNLFDTGIDRIRVSIPDGYGVPSITSVTVGGSGVAYTDASQSGVMEAQLASHVAYSLFSRLIEVRFQASTPVDLDSTGSNFVVQYDDAATPRPPEVATEGNANGIADRNDWRVVVVPGPVASVDVTPDSASLFVGETRSFSAAAFDSFGHPVARSFAWSTQGGVGAVDATGLFTASAVGSGLVIATAGVLSATAPVTVRPTRGIRIAGLTAPSALYQGQDSVAVRLTLTNLGADSIRLDPPALRFTRLIPGDADGDFDVTLASGSPAGIGPRGTVVVTALARVLTEASTGTVSIDASVRATEIASGIAVQDPAADAPVVALITSGGISVTAAQVPSSVLPGARNVVLATLSVTNHYPDARTVRSIRLTNRASGAGNPPQDQLDEELGDAALYKDDGDGALESGADTLLVQTSALSGSVTFAPLTLAIPPGATARLLVTASVPLDARDGDTLDVSLDDSTAVAFLHPPFFRTAWPLAPAGVFLVDGMAADQIRLLPGPSGNLQAGSSDSPALEFIAPPNGYRPDVLQKLGVVNFGTAEAGTDIARLRAWVDDGDSTFDASRDRLIGDLVNTGDRWQRTGLAETIPLGGVRLFVTVDLSDLARQGRTVQLGIPFGLDAGIGVQSGNSGPRDRAVRSLVERAVSTVDRITLTGADVESTTVHPGDRRVLLHHFVATNSYAAVRTLTGVVFTNATWGPGTVADRDGEIESATLRIDGDGDGRLDDPAVDPPLGTSFFSGGRAVFTGLAASIPAGAAVHFFLVTDVARNGARDGDALSAKVAGPLDLGFRELTTITAAWPIDSRARATVDGLMAAQITNIGAAGVTVGPGDGPILALNVVVPWNGYQPDTLRNLAVLNLGSATQSTGLEELRLWADGGDGIFSGSDGDDLDLGAMIPDSSAQVWRSPFLRETVGGAGRRLFVSLQTSGSARDSVTVRLAIPFGGVQMDTGDDGPLDAPIENDQPILISTSPLLATLETASAASTVGQPIVVRMIVRNVGVETVTGIQPAIRAGGTAAVLLDAGPGAAVDLVPAAVDTFVWTYHSTSAGSVQFTGGAEGTGSDTGLTRRAVETPSNVHRVYLGAAELTLFPVQSMPFNVTRGQTGVVPFSLTLTNGGGSGASDIRLRSFRLRLQDETGAGIVPASLLTHVSVNEGTNVYLSRSSLETSGSEMSLTLASPLRITAQEPVTISVRIDISDSTTTPAFRVVLADSTEILAEDATSGAPVTVRRDSGAFPVLSGLARLAADATELRVASLGGAAARVATGTPDVTLATLRLDNVGVAGITSDVQVNQVGITVADTSGAPLAQAASYLERLVLRSGVQTYAAQPVPGGGGPDVMLVLSPPLAVPAETPVDLIVSGDVADSARVGGFRLLLQPPSALEARDANSRDSVGVTYATTPTGGVPVLVEARAQRVMARGTALFPVSAVAGERDLPAIRIVLRHPGTAGTGRLRLDSLLVQVRDQTRATRVPDLFLDRMRLVQDGVEVFNLTSLPVAAVPIALPLNGALVEPGDSVVLLLVADLSPSAPASFLELAVGGSGILAADANSGQPVPALPEPGADFPLVSGLTRISSPARDLMAALQSRMPAALAVDGREVAVGVLTLRNAAAAGSGPIRVDRLRLRAGDPSFRPLAAGAAARTLAAYVNGALWARSDSLTVDSTEATLVAPAPVDVDAGQTLAIELRLVPQPAPVAASFRLGLDAAGVGVVQPGSALLTVQVSPEGGLAFPFWTESGSFTPASLAASWGNFPNPFAAGREATSFVYYLGTEADVTLRIWTPDGQGVATLLDRAPRGPGLHQGDLWNGRNGRGDVVRNGVYVAELIVKYADGSTERARRKVAVVR